MHSTARVDISRGPFLSYSPSPLGVPGLIYYPYRILFYMSGVPDVNAKQAESFKSVNVSGLWGGVSERGLEAVVYSDLAKYEKVLGSAQPQNTKAYIERTIECGLIINPMQMKSIHLWLGQKIKEYESLFAPIPSPEEVQSRSNKRNNGGLE
jgi:hypothetical protein